MTEPIFLQGICKDYLWGGNRLREEFGKESDADKIAEAMVAVASGSAPWAGSEGVRAWVRKHRSVASSSAAAAAVVRSALA